MDVFGRTGQTPSQWLRGQRGRGVAYDREIARRKAGGKVTVGGFGVSVIVTGVDELDRRIAKFSAQLQKKYIRQALNNAVKVVEKKFKINVPVDTGAMLHSIVRRTPKRQKRGVISRGLWITRKTLARAIRGVAVSRARKQFKGTHGKSAERALAVAAAKETTVDIEKRGFYPAFVEFGGKNNEPKRPMRDALYGSEAEIKKEFVTQLQAAVAGAAVRV